MKHLKLFDWNNKNYLTSPEISLIPYLKNVFPKRCSVDMTIKV